MKPFFVSLAAIVVISIGAKFVLQNADMSAQSVYSSQNASVRN